MLNSIFKIDFILKLTVFISRRDKFCLYVLRSKM